jgi:hypothetical protein
MAANSIRLRKCSNFGNRVIITKSVFWSRSHQTHSVRIDLGSHSI